MTGRRRKRRNRTLLALWWLAAVTATGLALVAYGITHRVRLPPADAQEIPSSVGSTAPGASVSAAPPLGRSDPVSIVIPAISVSAPVTDLAPGAVPPLDNHNLAGWDDGTVTPGQDGSSVILGHVDSYSGESVFFYLKELTKGDAVRVILADGAVARFTVDGVQRADKSAFPAAMVYGNTRYPSLRLVTCGGPFDPATGQYLDNIIVYAHLV